MAATEAGSVEDEQAVDYYVTVCDACLRASCWHDYSPCRNARGAGTTEMLRSVLQSRQRESAEHWTPARLRHVTGAWPRDARGREVVA